MLQPLGGEYAGTRELLTAVPFAPGYGVEIGLLIDAYDRLGLDAIAQVNLGVRMHRNRPLTELASMSRQVIATLLSRCGITDSGVGLTQFFADGDDYTPRASAVSLEDRPPMITLRPADPRRAVGPVRQYRGVTLILLYLVVLVLVAVVLFARRQRAVRPRRVVAAAAARHHRHRAAGLRRDRRRRRRVKFTQTLRGYKASEVDWVLDRLGQELDPLRGELAAVRARARTRRRHRGRRDPAEAGAHACAVGRAEDDS